MNVHEAIRLRHSVREYSPRPIPADVLQRLRDALRYSPSACNIQPRRFVWVGDAALRRRLSSEGSAAEWVSDAPWVVAACGYPQSAFPAMGGDGGSVDIDVAIAMDHLTLAAVGEGLGTCWIGSFSEERVKAILRVPKEVRVISLMPVGYPAGGDVVRATPEANRKTESELFGVDRF